MPSPNQRNWPSQNANGIPLTDPVAVSFNGDVVLFARQKGVVADTLYYNVRHNDPDAPDAGLEYSGWYELQMKLAANPKPGVTPSLTGLRVLGAGLVTLPASAQSAQPGDAPFAAVSDDRYIYIFRPSLKGTLYLDRFVLIQVPAPKDDNSKVRRDASSTKPTNYSLERIWELRYRNSGKKDTPANERDVLGYRDMLDKPFIEPTLELVEAPLTPDGHFAVVLLPTSAVDQQRWCHFAASQNTIQVTSWPQSSDGLFDFLPPFWSDDPPSSFSISPHFTQAQPLTCEAGIAVRVYSEQDPAKDGTKLRRAMRLMMTVPVSASAIGLTRALAVYDFNILPSGFLPAPSSLLTSALLDGQLSNGQFIPTTPLPARFPVPASAVSLAYNSTIYSYLLGSPQPAATPFLLDGGDGLIHCYYAGPNAGDPHPFAGDAFPFMVAQYSPEVARAQAALTWTAGNQTGTLDLVAQRPGTSLDQVKVSLADGAAPDLCNLTIDYNAALSGIGTELWVGLPRDLTAIIEVLNGQASGEPLARAVQDASVSYFDYPGVRQQARLPLTSATQPNGWLTLVSTRLDLPLAQVQVSAGSSSGKLNLLLKFSQGNNSVTQTWSDLPADSSAVRTILRGDASSFSYTPSKGDPWAMGLTVAAAATIFFFAAPSTPLSTTLAIAAGTTPDKVNVKLDGQVIGTDLPADSAAFTKALLAIPQITAFFPVISASDNSGPVPPQNGVQPLDLRALSSLFCVLPPTAAAPLAPSQVSGTVLQGHSQAPPQTTMPLVNRLVALSAVSIAFPNNGIAASLGNQAVSITPSSSNGAWVAAEPLNALTLPGNTAMIVPTVPSPGPNFDVMAPSKTFTLETWLRPNSGDARVFSFNGSQSGKTPLGQVEPSFLLHVLAQPALQFSVWTSGKPSYGYTQPNLNLTPTDAFTWEIWTKPTKPISTQPLGSLLQILNLQNPSPLAVEIALDAQLRPVFSAGNAQRKKISQAAGQSLVADRWTHIAVTGQNVDSQNNLWQVSLYIGGSETSIKDTQMNIVWTPFGPNSLIVGGLGNANTSTAAAALAEIRYWQIRRTRTDIQDSLYFTLAGTEPGLVGYWPLNTSVANGATLLNQCFFGGSGTAPNAALNATLVVSNQSVSSSADGTFLAMAAGVGGAPALKANAFIRSTHWNHIAISYQAGSAVHLNATRHDLVNCGHDSSLNASDAFSVEAWIQVESSTQKLPQSFIAKWGKDASEQSYWLGLDSQGQLNFKVQYEYKIGTQATTLQLVNAVPAAVTDLRDGLPHHVAATVQTATNTDKNTQQTTVTITATLYVDGKVVGSPMTVLPPSPNTSSVYSATIHATTVDLTLGAAVPTPTGTAPATAPEAQLYLSGMLTGVVLWSRAIDAKEIATSIQQRMAMQRNGAIAAWWFLEQAGVDAVDSVGGIVAKLSSNDLWAVYNRLSELLFYSNGHQLVSLEPVTDATILAGYPSGPTQFTLGGYQNGNALQDTLAAQFNEVRLWQQVRSARQIAEMRFTRLVGDEAGLAAYWNFDGQSLADGSLFGNNGVMWQNARPQFNLSAAPIANEGPAVLNVYGGQVTEFQQRLNGTPAVIEFSEVTRVSASALDAPATERQPPKLVGSVSRAYYYTSGTVNLTSGFYAGALRLVYLGQVQTDATLIGFIEGAPPVPSENLTRGYYASEIGYFGYFNASSISFSETESTTITYNTSYSHSGALEHATSGGFKLITDVGVELPAEGIIGGALTKAVKTDYKLGGKEKGGFLSQDLSQQNAASSWALITTDSLSLRGEWESADPAQFVNPQVGRRFLPDNVGYALVSSLTADVYLTYNAATNVAVGRVVVPNPDIPLDNNILTFQIDNTYIKNGTLDGKVGLFNDPDYPSANSVRGSYFKPIEAYRLKRQIAKQSADAERYFQQFDSYKRALGSDTSLDDQEPNRLVDRTSKGILARKGMANTYVWTAYGGLHTEQEQFTDQYTTTFTGGYSVNNLFGIGFDVWQTAGLGGPLFGGYFTLDWLGGFKIDITVSKARTQASAFGLNVSVTGEPALLTWDKNNNKYNPDPTPGKVASYRFNTFYLPPDTDNGQVLMTQVVDPNWLRSNDPDAVTLRSAQVGNPAWRVLHRVTYVNRIPPSLDNTPNETLPPPILRIVDLENNEVLVSMILAALGTSPPTPANVGAAVATVINPSQGASKLGALVPWWDDFLKTTRGSPPPVPSNYQLLQSIQLEILQYFLAGSTQDDGTTSNCKSFTGVSQATFDWVKKTSNAQHGTIYDPASGNTGTATTETPVGTVVLKFAFDSNAQTLEYCIESKPWVISASEVFAGIATSISDCEPRK